MQPVAPLPLVLGVLRRLAVATVMDRLLPPQPASGLSCGRGVAAHQAGFIPHMGEHFGPAAFRLKRPLGAMQGAYILPMPGWDSAGVQTCLGILVPSA
jgi:hypothetical protein